MGPEMDAAVRGSLVGQRGGMVANPSKIVARSEDSGSDPPADRHGECSGIVSAA